MLLLPLPPPQADRLPSAIINTRTPSIARQLRRRAGIHRNTSKASTAPAPAPGLLPKFGFARADDFAAVVVTVTDPVPLAVPEATLIFPPPLDGEQAGKFAAPAGFDVNAQVNVTVPVYCVEELNVTVDVADAPGLTPAGALAVSENAEAVTVTLAVPVPAAYTLSPL